MVSKVRQRAIDYMNRVPQGGLGSAGGPNEFDELVGHAPKEYTSRQDQKNKKPSLTFCNEFAGEVFRHATGTYIGAIDLEVYIKTGAKAYSWIEATSGKEPSPGDAIFKRSPFTHLAIVYKIEGGRLYTVEAGKNGPDPSKHEDYLGWSSSPWVPGEWVGWVDMDIFTYGPGHTDGEMTPEGIWNVTGIQRGTGTRYLWKYEFTDSTYARKVTWRDVYNGMYGEGSWSFEGQSLLIKWKSGSTDKWEALNMRNTKGVEEMTGEGTIDLEASQVKGL